MTEMALVAASMLQACEVSMVPKMVLVETTYRNPTRKRGTALVQVLASLTLRVAMAQL